MDRLITSINVEDMQKVISGRSRQNNGPERMKIVVELVYCRLCRREVADIVYVTILMYLHISRSFTALAMIPTSTF